MENFDYKKYSLDQLSNWVHDSVSCAEATPQEIYDTIKKAVEENYYIYKDRTAQCYELLSLLNGNGNHYLDLMSEKSNPWNDSLNVDSAGNYVTDLGDNMSSYVNYSTGIFDNTVDFWSEKSETDKVKKWVLPVEEDAASGECYLQLPDDLLQQVNWSEGEELEWIPQEDNSYILKKVTK
jgi:hypothetical protein